MDPKSDQQPEKRLSADITRQCILTRVRQISRVLTALYDEALRPFDINSPQFSLLVLIGQFGPISRADLGKKNHQGPSTLSRNLQLLITQGLVSEGPADEGGRRRPMTLTPDGIALMKGAASAWAAAQAKAKVLLGEPGADVILEIAEGLPQGVG